MTPLIPLTMDNAADAATLHATGFPRPWSQQEFNEMLAVPGTFGLLAGREGGAMGVILCRASFETCELLTIAVGGDFRRQGIARGLMNAAFAAARERGAERMLLEVSAANLPAQALYRSLGFAETGYRKGYYANGAEDALLMACVLA